MPLFQYYCGGCDSEFELLQKQDTPNWCTCPNCLFEAHRVDCPGGGFRIHGVGVYAPSTNEE